MSEMAAGTNHAETTPFARLMARAAVMALAAGLMAGCSAVPDWANPASVFSSDKPDETAADGAAFPDLANVPESAPTATPLDERKDIADGLVADREAARHTDEVLRGGTEAPAPAPVVAQPTPLPDMKDVPKVDDKQSSYEGAPTLGMPPRGGHATLDSAKRMANAEAPKEEDGTVVTDGVRAAPTTPVDVQSSQPIAPIETATP
ncbi:MAG: hypothetical protein GC184_11900 [Rhizobiales bacterium]|nr:hypothetical protein [Hyphomicrobiales bacterium]